MAESTDTFKIFRPAKHDIWWQWLTINLVSQIKESSLLFPDVDTQATVHFKDLQCVDTGTIYRNSTRKCIYVKKSEVGAFYITECN
jgi:hypothetical protein